MWRAPRIETICVEISIRHRNEVSRKWPGWSFNERLEPTFRVSINYPVQETDRFPWSFLTRAQFHARMDQGFQLLNGVLLAGASPSQLPEVSLISGWSRVCMAPQFEILDHSPICVKLLSKLRKSLFQCRIRSQVRKHPLLNLSILSIGLNYLITGSLPIRRTDSLSDKRHLPLFLC